MNWLMEKLKTGQPMAMNAELAGADRHGWIRRAG